MCISPTLPVHSLSTVKTSSVLPALIAWHTMVTGTSRNQAKLRGILEQSGAPEVQCAWPSGEREREMFYLTTHSTHFIYGYMASDIWLRNILIERKETRCRHIGYSYRLTHTTAFVTPVVEHWLEREIAQWVHSMKDRSDNPLHHERTLYLWATSRSPWPSGVWTHSDTH